MPASRGATTSSALAATTGSCFLIHSTPVERSRLLRSASTMSALSIHWIRHCFLAGSALRISQTQPTYLRCLLVHRATCSRNLQRYQFDFGISAKPDQSSELPLLERWTIHRRHLACPSQPDVEFWLALGVRLGAKRGEWLAGSSDRRA